MPTEAKRESVAELREALAQNRTLIVSEYRGLTVREIAEIRRALEEDPTNAVVLYQAAVIGALRDSPDVAISWLERAIRAGYPAADAERDPFLESLRDLPAFGNAVKSRA